MKLRKIKLSGFKSFIDSTSLYLQSNLIGIVGPNGCGKSNITDAIRWVMGEISAKQLRGELMSDVIFNGSSTRKPAGQAEVELIFDNNDASFGGEYASYNEIAIRRKINRDGCSEYSLNNIPCRRKDITNIFLGTGLGLDSYAIIEQGTISKFIEAKSDDLRTFIEEAAGVSKYKERRRETENRIKHTKENLFRLNDVLEEIDKQLKHLKLQANTAEKYQKLKQEERLTRAELLVLHWREVNKRIYENKIIITKDKAVFVNKTNELHVLDERIIALREEYNNYISKLNDTQENYYQICTNITCFEQQIKYANERQEQLSIDLTQANQIEQEILQQQSSNKDQFKLLSQEKSKIALELKDSELVLSQTKQSLYRVEEQVKIQQKSYNELNLNNSTVSQDLQIEETKITHLQSSIANIVSDIKKFKIELTELNFQELNTSITDINNLLKDAQVNQERLQKNLMEKKQQIVSTREVMVKLVNILDQSQSKLQVLIGRKSSLEALQQTALGKSNPLLTDWLRRHNLEQKPRLAQKLRVVVGWEIAVEIVLGVYLEAVCVEDIDSIIPVIKDSIHINLILFDRLPQSQYKERSDLITLVSKINSQLPISNLLSGIYVAEDIDEALNIKSQLNCRESVITRSGIWFGQNWIRITYDTNPKIGILQREKELQELNNNIIEAQSICAKEKQKLTDQQNVLVILEEEHSNLQQSLHKALAEYSNIQSQIIAKKINLQYIERRSLVLEQEIASKDNVLIALQGQLSASLIKKDDAIKQQASYKLKLQKLSHKQDEVQKVLGEVQKVTQKTQEKVTNFTLHLKLLENQLDHLIQNLERDNNRLSDLKEQQLIIMKSLEDIGKPFVNLNENLQLESKHRLEVENILSEIKHKIINIEQELHNLEQQQIDSRGVNERIRVSLENIHTECAKLQVKSDTYLEQVTELGLKLDEVNITLPENEVIQILEDKLINLTSFIENLGLINLTAIDEFNKLNERRNYLNSQNRDLEKALNSLEGVIQKIDYDTKVQFKEAYDKINLKFQELFPKIFNGGKAYLEQTIDNLVSGISIMVRPPGKRNSSIHLLSGGEKALTAIALIFSIFHLNPAPFCILDEVDAPLDEINVSRFCNLIKEMATSVQFIFVTHNKLTMEIASQLIGVTMQESGVSRIVTVDIDVALALANLKNKSDKDS
ncbi:MAG: chromosome segregation protein SMC [Coxiellaceae bacterium]|jgi:chromosome segregation protein|nr:chromosome segregation protein SMC [Coxiellaceae bacterium]